MDKLFVRAQFSARIITVNQQQEITGRKRDVSLILENIRWKYKNHVSEYTRRRKKSYKLDQHPTTSDLLRDNNYKKLYIIKDKPENV